MVLDAGHGSSDSGKVGINGVLEKDINLSISKKTKKVS
ncbi:MAG: N-acetylmuramoyl-L-alanine amidase [Christensenellales bacterium]